MFGVIPSTYELRSQSAVPIELHDPQIILLPWICIYILICGPYVMTAIEIQRSRLSVIKRG